MCYVRNFASLLTLNAVGRKVAVQGWIRHKRNLKSVTFLSLEDGRSPHVLQAIFDPLVARAAKQISLFNVGCAVRVNGEIIKSPAKGQLVELVAESIDVIGECDLTLCDYQPNRRQNDVELRQIQHLRMRSMPFQCLMRLRHAIIKSIHSFFDSYDFTLVHPPLITTNDCEGSGESFSVEVSNRASNNSTLQNFFSSLPGGDLKMSYLAVSAQLHLEALALGLNRVYALNPAFRAAPSTGRHHLAELWMLEAELAWVDNVEELMLLVEDCVKFVTNSLITNCEEDLVALKKFERLVALNDAKRWLRLDHKEALEVLEKQGVSRRDGSFNKSQEKSIVDYCGGRLPVFVTRFPAADKPFYMKRAVTHQELAECFDLIAPHSGELCGGSLRESNASALKSRLEELNLLNSLQWYLDLRTSGYARSGGFGIGLERLMMYLLDIKNIKDAIAFPRWYRHLLC